MATTVWKFGRLRINHADDGISEIYHLGDINFAQARTIMRAIGFYRRAFLAADCRIVSNSVHTRGTPRDRSIAYDGVLTAWDAATWRQKTGRGNAPAADFNLNVGADKMLFNVENGEGAYSTRGFRFIPDYFVEKQTLVAAVNVTPWNGVATAAMAEDPNLSASDLQERFLRFLIQYTVIPKQNTQISVDPAPKRYNYDLVPIVNFSFEAITSAKPGRPFKR